MPNPSILWGFSSSGYTYANTLTFGYPLYDWVTDRVQRPGSAQVQSVAGTEDSWITGRDYTLSGQVRWIPDNSSGVGGTPTRALVAGPIQWQDFLDYARAKNKFRFVPDGTLTNFYVDGCYLVEPITGFGQNSARLDRQFQMTIRNPSVDFTNALRGIMLEYAPGLSLTDPLTWTFTRADAAKSATYVDSNGSIQTVDANVLRDSHYISGVRTTLMEGSRTNVCLHSQDFAGTWTIGGLGTLVIADNNTTLGDLKLARFSTLAGNTLTRSVTLAGGVEAYSVFVKGDGNAASFDVFLDDSGATRRLNVRISITAGGVVTASATTGTVINAPLIGSSVYRVLMQSTSAAAGAGTLTAFSANTGTSLIFGGCDVEDAAFPSSYIKTVAATVTRAADSLSLAIGAPLTTPQNMTIYAKLARPDWADAGALTADKGIVSFGNAAAGDDLLVYGTGAPVWRAETGLVNAVTAVPAGATQEVLGQFKNLNTAPQAAIDVGSGLSAFSGTGTAFSSFLTNTVYVGNYQPAGATQLYGGLITLRVAAGLMTMAQMRTL